MTEVFYQRKWVTFALFFRTQMYSLLPLLMHRWFWFVVTINIILTLFLFIAWRHIENTFCTLVKIKYIVFVNTVKKCVDFMFVDVIWRFVPLFTVSLMKIKSTIYCFVFFLPQCFVKVSMLCNYYFWNINQNEVIWLVSFIVFTITILQVCNVTFHWIIVTFTYSICKHTIISLKISFISMIEFLLCIDISIFYKDFPQDNWPYINSCLQYNYCPAAQAI
jgi:hypothetical protein